MQIACSQVKVNKTCLHTDAQWQLVLPAFPLQYIPPPPNHNGHLCSQTAARLEPLKPRFWLSVHGMAFGQLDKHPRTLLSQGPRKPQADFQAFLQSQSPHGLRETYLPKRYECEDCCHFLIIKSDETAIEGLTVGITIFCNILVDSGICCGSNPSHLEIGRTKYCMISDICIDSLDFDSKDCGGKRQDRHPEGAGALFTATFFLTPNIGTYFLQSEVVEQSGQNTEL